MVTHAYRSFIWLLWAAALPAAAERPDLQTDTTQLTWRIENPFRLFRDAADFEKLRMLPGESVQSWFSRHAHLLHGDYLPFRRTWWDPQNGENSTGQYQPGYLHPASHRVIFQLAGEPAGSFCHWTVETLPSPGQSKSPAPNAGARKIRAPCERVTFELPFVPVTPDDSRGSPVQVSVSTPTGRMLTTTASVKDILILGLGDSFSAGEGSPDSPAQLTRHDSNFRRTTLFPNSSSWVWVPGVASGRGAQWWDHECHRSLLSWQALSALRLASDLSESAAGKAPVQSVVTFASFACSGAKIDDGLLYPQTAPPGPLKAGPAGNKSVQRSQLHAASYDLCDGYGTPILSGGLHKYRYQQCPHAKPRTPDALLVSIGGNDAGFAKVIMHTLIPGPISANSPPGAVVLAMAKKIMKTSTPTEARAQAEALGERLNSLPSLLQNVLRVRKQSVVFMQYPNPLRRPKSLQHGHTSPRCGLEMRAGMEATRFLSPVLREHWHMWGTQAEFKEVEDDMVNVLQQVIQSNKGEWQLVTSHLEDFLEHGLCADAVTPEDDEMKHAKDALLANVQVYGLPRQHINADSSIAPLRPYYFDGAHNPALRRWFRTPNDSVQIQTQATIQQSLSGAFHPDGQGYARMADAAFEKMKDSLMAHDEPGRPSNAATAQNLD